MKKLLTIALVALLCVSLAGCAGMMNGMDTTTPADATSGTDAAAGTNAAAGTDATSATDTASATDAAGTTSARSGSFSNLFQLVLAAYLLYNAIRGKGKLFENKYTKCPYEKYRLVMRILCVVASVLLGASGALELSGAVPPTSPICWILWAVGFLALIALLVFNVAMTDRKAAAAAAQAEREGQLTNPKDPLHDAFVFDDEEANEKERASMDEFAEKARRSANDPLRDAFVFSDEEVAKGEFKSRADDRKD